MDTANQVCHDLKTDRPDIGQPLPAILTFLPILFVMSALGAIVLSALFFFQLQSAEKGTEEWKVKVADTEAEKGKLAVRMKEMKAEDKRAKDVRKWVEGSSLLQPLILTITRSTDSHNTAISELSLFRDLANSEQIRLGFKISGDVHQQLEDTLTALREFGYQAYQAQQTVGKNGKSLDYQATLIRKSGAESNINLSSNE